MAHPDPSLNSAALLVIDVQDTFVASPRWAHRSNPNFEANMTELIRAFRAAGRPVIFFLHSDKDPGWTTDSPNYKLQSFLDRRSDEPLLHKTSRNAFTTTNLAQILQEHGVLGRDKLELVVRAICSRLVKDLNGSRKVEKLDAVDD